MKNTIAFLLFFTTCVLVANCQSITYYNLQTDPTVIESTEFRQTKFYLDGNGYSVQFTNCTFDNVTFVSNQVDTIDFDACTFRNSKFQFSTDVAISLYALYSLPPSYAPVLPFTFPLSAGMDAIHWNHSRFHQSSFYWNTTLREGSVENGEFLDTLTSFSGYSTNQIFTFSNSVFTQDGMYPSNVTNTTATHSCILRMEVETENRMSNHSTRMENIQMTHIENPYFPRLLCYKVHESPTTYSIALTLKNINIALLYPNNSRDPYSTMMNIGGRNRYYSIAYEQELESTFAPILNPTMQKRANGTSRAHLLLNFGNHPVQTTIYNVVRQDVFNVSKSLYDGVSDTIEFPMDSVVRFHQFDKIVFTSAAAAVDSIQLSVLTGGINSTHPNGLDIKSPIRTGILYTGGSIDDGLFHLYPTLLNVTKKFQYVPKHLRDHYYPQLSAFQADIEIEPNLQVDEMRAYGGGTNLCHYLYRQNTSTECLLTAPSEKLYSATTEGSCYRITRSHRPGDALANCPFSSLCISPNVAWNDAAILSSYDLFTETPSLTIRSCDVNRRALLSMQSDATTTTEEYQSLYFPTVPLGDVFFTVFHPFVISSRYNLSIDVSERWQKRLSTLRFENIQFQYKYSTSPSSRAFFTTVQFQPSSSPPILENNPVDLLFLNCTYLGINLDASNSLDWSKPIRFLETKINTAYNFLYAIHAGVFTDNITSIHSFTMNNSQITLLGGLFGGGGPGSDINSYMSIEENLTMHNNQFLFMSNGWARVRVNGNVSLSDMSCLECLPETGTFLGASLDIRGTGASNALLYMRNLEVNSTNFVDGSGSTNVFTIHDFPSPSTNIILENLSSLPASSTGIYYTGLASIPCDRDNLGLTWNANRRISGRTQDVRCDPFNLGCSGIQCVYDIQFSPIHCIIDPSWNIYDKYFSIIYFHTHQDASVGCRATDGFNNRNIYANGNFIYDVSSSSGGILFTNRNGTSSSAVEKTIWRPLASLNGIGAPKVVLYGENHRVAAQSLTQLMDVEFHGYRFSSMRGVVSTDPLITTPAANYIIGQSVSSDALRNVVFNDTKFYGFIPTTLLQEKPQNISAWNTFEALWDTLSSSVSAPRPLIQQPNVISLVSFQYLQGNNTFIDVKLYGSLGVGVVLNGPSTTGGIIRNEFTRVIGENLWGAGVQITGIDQSEWRQVVFDEMCGGYSPVYPIATNVEVVYHDPVANGAAILDWENVSLRSFRTPQIGPRLLTGNPLVAGGYIRQARISGVKGASFTRVFFRKVFIGKELPGEVSVFPVGLEISNADRIAWSLNEVGIPYILDTRTLMRQLYITNLNSGGNIGGSLYGIRSAGTELDALALPATYCNNLCPPLYAGAATCRVGKSLVPSGVYPVSPVDFEYYDEALLYCPFNQLTIWDSNVTLSPSAPIPFVYSLYNARSAIPNGQLKTTCRFGVSTCQLILGSNRLVYQLQGCPLSLTLPTDVIFQNVDFVFSTGCSIQFESTTFPFGCNSTSGVPQLNSVQFLSSRMITTTNTITSAYYLIQCIHCRVANFVLTNTRWNISNSGVAQSVKGIWYEPAADMTNDVLTIQSQSPDTASIGAFAPYLWMQAPRSVLVQSVRGLRCITNALACIRLRDVSRLASVPQIRDINMIGFAPSTSLYPTIGHLLLIEKLTNLTSLSEVPTYYTSGIINVVVNPGGFPMVGGMAAPNMLSFYPCTNGTCVYIQTLPSASPLTKAPTTGIYQEWFYADTPNYVLLSNAVSTYYPTLTSECLYSRRTCNNFIAPARYYEPHAVEVFLVVLILVFVPALLWLLFGGGLPFLFGNVGLWVTYQSIKKADLESQQPMLKKDIDDDE